MGREARGGLAAGWCCATIAPCRAAGQLPALKIRQRVACIYRSRKRAASRAAAALPPGQMQLHLQRGAGLAQQRHSHCKRPQAKASRQRSPRLAGGAAAANLGLHVGQFGPPGARQAHQTTEPVLCITQRAHGELSASAGPSERACMCCRMRDPSRQLARPLRPGMGSPRSWDPGGGGCAKKTAFGAAAARRIGFMQLELIPVRGN